MVGADYARGPLTLGLSVGRTLGMGGYSGPSGGRMTTSMTGFYPWVGYQVNDPGVGMGNDRLRHRRERRRDRGPGRGHGAAGPGGGGLLAAAGAMSIKAAHVMELRTAVLAVE